MSAYAMVDTKFLPPTAFGRWNAFREGVNRGVRDYSVLAQKVEEFGIDMHAWRGHDTAMIRNMEVHERASQNVFDIFENMSVQSPSFRDMDFDRSIDR